MKRIGLCLLVIVALGALADSVVVAQEKAHEVLKQDVGDWDCEMKMWMAGPDSDPMVAKGTETNKMFGEFWVMSEFKADMGGLPFEGRGMVGYDPAKKKYVGTWVDTMNPYISHMEGTYDEAKKTMTMMMKGTGPDGKPMVSKSVSELKDDGKTRMFTMYNKMPGSDEWAKSMELTYTKK